MEQTEINTMNNGDASNNQTEEKKEYDGINFYQGQTNLLKQIREEHQKESNSAEKQNGKEDNDNEKELEEKCILEIKTKIAEFFNVKNVSFLFGCGTSSPAIPIMRGLFCSATKKLVKLKNEEKNNISGDIYKKAFEEFKSIHKRIENKKNLEEILGILYSNRTYLENYIERKEDLEVCNKLIEVIEEEVFENINVDFENDESKNTLNYYQTFYQKLALRNRDVSRLNIFTTNNDLFNETAMDSLNMHYINGFGGGLHRFFNPALFNYTFAKRMDTSIDKYEPADNVVNLFKLHGSVNWAEDTSDKNVFFKIKELGYPIKHDSKKEAVLIYPTPTKQNKSLGSPYVELFREFQKRLLLPHSVLFIIGYSFSDEHVNNVIYQALATNSSINIVILNNLADSPISKSDDNRIFRLWGKDRDNNSIHYFNYIVNNLIPNIDHNKTQDEFINKFISFYNKD
ncbi:MAG: SIR2 family protein, partial [Acholeplasmataceae bacterium]